MDYPRVKSLSEHLMYTRLAMYYDVIYRDYLESIVPKLVNAYEESFRRFAKREVKEVLDIACGTGGPTIELARRGYIVSGVDLHEEVVNIARSKASKLGLKIRFAVCDARELGKVFNEGSFDAVTMFFTSIAYMKDLNDLTRLLSSVKHVLRSGGVFVADTVNSYDFMFRLGRDGVNRAVIWDVKGLSDDEHVVITDWRELADWINGVTALKRVITIIKEGGSIKSYLMSDTLRLHTAGEFKLIAEKIGFSECKVMCYSKGKALNPEDSGRCGRLLFIAVK